MKQASLSSADVREKNAKRLLRYIYDHGSASKQGISHELAMSLPTVTQNINRWEELGIIEKTGQFESTGGRKAFGYHIASTLKVAIGVSILKEFYHVTLVDLYGRPLFSKIIHTPFSKDDEYFQILTSEIMLIVRKLELQDEQIQDAVEIIAPDVNERVDQVPGDISAQQRHHAVEHRHEKHHKKHPRPGFPDKSVNIKQTREKPAEYFFKVSRDFFKIFRFGRFFSFLPQRRHVHGRSLYIYF